MKIRGGKSGKGGICGIGDTSDKGERGGTLELWNPGTKEQ
jgi:hypothetical protein